MFAVPRQVFPLFIGLALGVSGALVVLIVALQTMHEHTAQVNTARIVTGFLMLLLSTGLLSHDTGRLLSRTLTSAPIAEKTQLAGSEDGGWVYTDRAGEST